MSDQEPTHREAVERARRAAVLAENVLDNGGQVERSLAWSATSRAWSAVAGQLPVVEIAARPRPGAHMESECREQVTEFIPRVVEPVAEALCYCDGEPYPGHVRGARCT